MMVRHSIKDTKTDCTACGKETLIRLPPDFMIGAQKTSPKGKKAGDVVKSSIEEFREDLRQEKKKHKDKEYEGK
tara:strand:- start:280 stop:501 length:222 start_codon:yes stop_codon:yes gene_type:complete